LKLDYTPLRIIIVINKNIYKEIMKKISKEEWKKIFEDESYQKNEYISQEKSLKMRCLEETINFVRFELLYPKMEIEYSKKGDYEKFPKGAGSAVIANIIAGAYICGKENLMEGVIIGGASAFIQMVFGMSIRWGSEYISKRYKGIKEKRETIEDKTKIDI
jgi:hypothetical protein